MKSNIKKKTLAIETTAVAKIYAKKFSNSEARKKKIFEKKNLYRKNIFALLKNFD